MIPTKLGVDDPIVQDAIVAVLRATNHRVEIPPTVMRDSLQAAFDTNVYPRCPSCAQRHPVTIRELLNTARAEHVGL